MPSFPVPHCKHKDSPLLINSLVSQFGQFLKTLLIPIGLAIALSACTHTAQNENVEKTEEANKEATEDVAAEKSAPESPQFPEHELTEDILYDFTIAEIASQRGENELAFDKYYALAEKTRDTRIIKSAVRIALVSKNEVHISKSVSLWGELEPDNIDVQQVLAVALLGVEQDQMAAESLINMLRLSSDRADGMRRVNVILSQLKKSERLYLILDELNKVFPEDYYSTLYDAKFSLKFGDYQRAERQISKTLQYKPNDFTGIMLKVNLLKKTERLDETAQLFEEVIPEFEDPSLLRLEYAKFLIETKQIETAIEQLELIAEDNQDKGDILYAIGLLAMEVKAYEKAEHFYLKLYRLEERKNQGAFLMGKLELARKDENESLKWFARVQSGKYQYEAVLHRAIILSDQKKYSEAIEVLDEHKEETGKKYRNQLRLKAEILNQAKQFEQSYQVYTLILDDEPEQPEVLYGRAMVAEKLGRIDLMEQDLLKIIEKNPEDSHALNALGYTLTENTERYAEAQTYIQRALEIEPNDMATIDSMGWVLYKQGQLKEALSYLKRAYEMQHDPEIAAHYGEVLWMMDNRDLAKQVWQKAKESFPDHAVLKATTDKFLK